ncbi:hypothetical protein POTOM_034472 [Populus tomentosa]|uniref:Chromo domain-containing protein n=1 Tax=Populus tomentosa TaxID=118781 RepID=A0A8X7Z1B9_POPTO|nr:hypothetical protein POTOM_034472 [Populus tomentosa]
MSNTYVPNNSPCEHADLQQQIIHITTVLEQLSNRLDAVDERRARSPNRRGRGQFREETSGEHLDTEYRDVEPQHHRLQHHREELPRHRDRRGLENQPIDELTKRMKVDVPDFYGKLDPYTFEDWLTAIEDYFDWFAVSEDRKVRYIRMKLKGHARVWWGSVEEQLRRTQRPPISHWDEMKERLKEKYLPIDYEQMMFEEMLQLKQGTLTVEQYTDKFHELTIRSRIAETDQQTLARYRNGLRGELYKEMLIARLITVEEAYQLALRIEKQIGNATGKKTMPMDFKTGHTTSFSVPRQHSSQDRLGGSIPGGYKDKNRTNDGPQCYKCKGFGHYAVETSEGETDEVTNEEEEHLGKKLVLVPLPIAEFEATNKKVPILNMHQFSQAVNGEQMLLFVVRQEVKQDDAHTTGLEGIQTQYMDDGDFSTIWSNLKSKITITEEVKRRLSHSTDSYAAAANTKRKDRQFNSGDMVLVRLKLECFPPGSFTKLHARRAGPFQVTKKLGSNAYVIDLPSEFGISPIFNIEDITAFKGDINDHDHRSQTEDTPACLPKAPTTSTPQEDIASISDHQFVSTRRGGYYKFLVQWRHRSLSDSAWIKGTELQRLHPELFAAYVHRNLPESSSSWELAIDANQEAGEETP